jgi:hypothetical protein
MDTIDPSQYALSNDKPDICRYLLEHGADGNAIEKADCGDGQYESVLPFLSKVKTDPLKTLTPFAALRYS